MTTINYEIGGVAKTLSVDLPIKFYVRVDWNTDHVLAASAKTGAFKDDPVDMYRYGTVTSAKEPIFAFILLAQYTDIELATEELKAAYAELVSEYAFTQIFNAATSTVTTTVETISKPKADKVGTYTLNGVEYAVALQVEDQNTVTSITVGVMAKAIAKTVVQFSNGVVMPITADEWMEFAIWFATQRNKFFITD
jgi:hypothetical protein